MKSRAMIHEMLDQSRDLAGIDFREYIPRIVNFFSILMLLTLFYSRYTFNLSGLEMNRQGKHLGLITNEKWLIALNMHLKMEKGAKSFGN